MSVVSINSRNRKLATAHVSPFWSIGFRPFFFGAAIFAVISISYWTCIYVGAITPQLGSIPSIYWHAHEMIYGYTIAVIAGFLLTAVTNWTGIATPSGSRLALLFSGWAGARVCWLFGALFAPFAIVLDVAFMAALIYSIAAPIIKSKQWKQIGVLSKVFLLSIGNLIFYLGLFNADSAWLILSAHGGLLLVVALIMTIATRVLPGYIRNSLDINIDNQSYRWIMPANMIAFIIFFCSYLVIKNNDCTTVTAFILFLTNFLNLQRWYVPGIWKIPLLWGLYLAIAAIALGFLLFALGSFHQSPLHLSLHAFAYGGIGLSTLSMMSRVIIGHTGRSIHSAPKGIAYAQLILIFGFIGRVIIPIFLPGIYLWCIIASQIAWVIAFFIFLSVFTPMMFRPSVNG